MTQGSGRDTTTLLTLTGGNFSHCGTSSRRSRRASAARSSGRSVRHLWGSGKGHFRTQGRYAAATVRGTIWYTEDRCGATRVTVARGVVTVSQFHPKRRVKVGAGHGFTAFALRR